MRPAVEWQSVAWRLSSDGHGRAAIQAQHTAVNLSHDYDVESVYADVADKVWASKCGAS